MTERGGRLETWSAAGARLARLAAVAIALMVVAAAAAQERQTAETPQSPAVSPAPSAPVHKPGVLEVLGRWVDESVAGVRTGFGSAWTAVGGVGGHAGTAAKDAAEVATTVAKGAAGVAKDTADVVGRLPGSRFISGRERCASAPNGAPDCRLAAEALCKAQGFNSGSSVEYETAEKCPAQVMLEGRRSVPGECPVEHVVTKALCQ